MKKLFPLVTFILIATLVGGCGGTKTIKTDQGSVSVSEDKNQINVKTNDGNNSQLAVSQNGEGVALPTDYPKDLVPIIDGANVNMANRNEDANKKVSYWVAYFTDKNAKDAYTVYQDALKDLTDSQKMEVSGSYVISGMKGDKAINVTISTEENDGKKQTLVNITIVPKK